MVSDRAVAFIGLIVLSIILAISASCASMPMSATGPRYVRLVNGSSHVAQVYYIGNGGNRWRLSSRLGPQEERDVRVPGSALRGGQLGILLAVEHLDGLALTQRDRYDVAFQEFTVQPCTKVEVRLGPQPASIGPTGRLWELC